MAAPSHPSSKEPEPGEKAERIGFSDANWDAYLLYRPNYPPSFFERIYAYHSQKEPPALNVAHDVGAGCGVVSTVLASRFNSLNLVFVSDPNGEYISSAHKALMIDENHKTIIPGTNPRLRFLNERAEQSSVPSGTVDLVTVCECIHWTDPVAAIKEFRRELRPGGTLVIAYYGIPRILPTAASMKDMNGRKDEGRAQNAWMTIWDHHWTIYKDDELCVRAFRTVNTGLEYLEFPPDEWEMVKRQYINAHGSVLSFKLNDFVDAIEEENHVHAGEERVFDEDDEDWMDFKDYDWFRGYQKSWMTADVSEPENEKELWDELRVALNGEKVKIEFPVVMIFATKR